MPMVPRLHRYFAVLRLPPLVSLGSGFPCLRPTPVRIAPQQRIGGSPKLLDRPLRTRRGQIPRRMRICLAICSKPASAFRENRTLGIREEYRFRGRYPAAHTFA